MGSPYEYGVPGARHAVFNGDRTAVGGGAPVSAEPRHVLVVANETVAGRSLIEALERRAEAGPVRITVICPINAPREGYVVYEDTRRAAAGRRLDRTLAALQADGHLRARARRRLRSGERPARRASRSWSRTR